MSRDFDQVQSFLSHSKQSAWLWCLTRGPGSDRFSGRAELDPADHIVVLGLTQAEILNLAMNKPSLVGSENLGHTRK